MTAPRARLYSLEVLRWIGKWEGNAVDASPVPQMVTCGIIEMNNVRYGRITPTCEACRDTIHLLGTVAPCACFIRALFTVVDRNANRF